MQRKGTKGGLVFSLPQSRLTSGGMRQLFVLCLDELDLPKIGNGQRDPYSAFGDSFWQKIQPPKLIGKEGSGHESWD